MLQSLHGLENTEKTLLGWVNLFSIQKGKENYIDLTEIHIRGKNRRDSYNVTVVFNIQVVKHVGSSLLVKVLIGDLQPMLGTGFKIGGRAWRQNLFVRRAELHLPVPGEVW